MRERGRFNKEFNDIGMRRLKGTRDGRKADIAYMEISLEKRKFNKKKETWLINDQNVIDNLNSITVTLNG